jgi:hypothetical protein
MLKIGVAISTAFLLGCASQRSESLAHETRHLPTDDYELAFSAALRGVSKHFQIKTRDEAGGVIETHPRIGVTQATGQISETLIPRRANVRRTARVRIRRTSGAIYADCRVVLERLDTEKRDNQQWTREFNDLPNYTPIERGVRPSEASQYWTNLGHDTQMGRRVLSSVWNFATAMHSGEKPEGADRPATE